MPRAKSSVAKKRRRNRTFKAAKGFVGGRGRLARTAMESVNRAMAYAYRDRKVKKREFRALWITRLNAAARQNGLSYSRLIDGLTKSNMKVDRKVLAYIAVHDEAAFIQIVELAKSALN